MVSYKSYLRALHSRFGLLGAWPPNQRVEPGAIGVVQEGVFRRVSALHHLGVDFITLSALQPGALEYSEGAELHTSAQAEAATGVLPGAPQASARVRFTHEGGFLFSASGLTEARIDDTLGVQAAILDLWRKGSWDPDWVIVDRVLSADVLTVLISAQRGGEVDLDGSSVGQGAGLGLGRSGGDTLRFQGEAGLTPLYGALRLDRRLVRKDRLEAAPLSFLAEPDDEEIEILEEVTP